MPIEQDRSYGDPVKTEYDEDQGVALVESDEEAVELRSTALLRMAAKHSAAIFVGPSGERFRKKPEGLKRAAGQTASVRTPGARGQPGKRRVSGLPEQGVKGNAVPFGRVKRRQSLIWVLGRSVRRRSRARPRPVKCWEPTLSTGYYLPTNIPVSMGSGGRGDT